MTQVVVVGAGVGGLSAAVRLAALGHDVTVLEHADEPGGKLGVIRRDGFVFDTGPSLVTIPDILEDLFAATGVPLHEVLDLERLPVAARYRFPDGTQLDMPGHLADIPAALDAALGPGRGEQWSSFLRRAERMWEASRATFLENPLTAEALRRNHPPLRDLPAIAPLRSLRGIGRAHLTDPRLRMLLDRYATYTGSDPRRAPAALATVPWAEQAYGSWYVRGGLGQIATALQDRLRSLGGRIEFGTSVGAITTERGRASGVALVDGTHIPADVVVANADARSVYGHLLRTRSTRRMARRVLRPTPSFSGFVLLLALDDPPAGHPHHEVLFAEDYDAEFDALFGRNGGPRPVERPTIYISAPDDPSVVPGPGTAAWFVLVNAPRHEPGTGFDWDAPALAEDYADRVLELMAERGVDVRDRIRWREILSPADLERRTLTPGGSIYGSSSNGARAAFLRPQNASPVPGVYLVGGSSHPGGGLPLVMLSAKIVAEIIGP
ncbi:phytoene desaturase family protein [Williamsia sp. SKLECPSW1]